MLRSEERFCAGLQASFFLLRLALDFVAIFLRVETKLFFLTWDCCCPWIRPQLPHAGSTGPVRDFAGVVSPLRPQNRTQGHTGASFVFIQKTSFPSPYRGGARYRPSWVCPARPQLAHTASTGPAWGFTGVHSPPRPQKSHTGPHGAKFGFHRLLLGRFGFGSAANSFSSL